MPGQGPGPCPRPFPSSQEDTGWDTEGTRGRSWGPRALGSVLEPRCTCTDHTATQHPQARGRTRGQAHTLAHVHMPPVPGPKWGKPLRAQQACREQRRAACHPGHPSLSLATLPCSGMCGIQAPGPPSLAEAGAWGPGYSSLHCWRLSPGSPTPGGHQPARMHILHQTESLYPGLRTCPCLDQPPPKSQGHLRQW